MDRQLQSGAEEPTFTSSFSRGITTVKVQVSNLFGQSVDETSTFEVHFIPFVLSVYPIFPI